MSILRRALLLVTILVILHSFQIIYSFENPWFDSNVVKKHNATNQTHPIEQQLQEGREENQILKEENQTLKEKNSALKIQLAAKVHERIIENNKKVFDSRHVTNDVDNNDEESSLNSLGQYIRKKESSLTDTPFQDKKVLCFVHVGKTAGSKISCEIGLTYANTCKGSNLPSKNVFQQRIIGRMHMDSGACQAQSDLFLVATRDPLERMISWFHYSLFNAKAKHLQKRRLYNECAKELHKSELWENGCFSSFDEFAKNCVPNAPVASCKNLAWNVARGEVPCIFHNHFNYKYYRKRIERIINKRTKKMSIDTSLAVFRHEYLVEDFYNVNRMFGGEVTSLEKIRDVFNSSINSGRENFTGLSEEGRRNLCFALSEEIEEYKNLIMMAENLNATQREDSIKKIHESCPSDIFVN